MTQIKSGADRKRNKGSGFGKFLLLWTGELISSVGGGLTAFGLGVYIFNQTGSAAGMALVTLLGFLPTLLFSVPAGVLADRYDRRLLMMVGDGFSALGILYILVCMMRGEAVLWQICAGVFVSAAFSALLEPAFRATITDLLTKEEFSKAFSLAYFSPEKISFIFLPRCKLMYFVNSSSNTAIVCSNTDLIQLFTSSIALITETEILSPLSVSAEDSFIYLNPFLFNDICTK